MTKIVFVTLGLFVFVQDKPKHPTNDVFRRMLAKCIWCIWVQYTRTGHAVWVREYI